MASLISVQVTECCFLFCDVCKSVLKNARCRGGTKEEVTHRGKKALEDVCREGDSGPES